jgi:uncharacterized membrane protein YhaH (DUF805 family)
VDINLDGRIGRKTFWIASIAVVVIEVVIATVAAAITKKFVNEAPGHTAVPRDFLIESEAGVEFRHQLVVGVGSTTRKPIFSSMRRARPKIFPQLPRLGWCGHAKDVARHVADAERRDRAGRPLTRPRISVRKSCGRSDYNADVVMFLHLFPQFVIAVKRAHDRNISTWIVSTWLVLLVTTDVLDFFGWLPTRLNLNVFSPTNLLLFAYLMVAGIISLALLIELCFRHGTNGPNRYGPDPLAKA